MVPLNNIKRYWICYILFLAISLAGCSSNSGPCKGCSAEAFAPYVNLKFIDPVTKQDLFFGPNPKYSLSLLKLKHVERGLLDSVPTTYKLDITNHLLNLRLHYQNPADTIAIQIGTQKPKMLVLYTGALNNCCARVVITQAKYQDSLIFMAPVDPVQQAKLPDWITVPF